jgi:high frequency lysogenization protein
VADPLHDRTLALAGLFQAARLVQTLAREGRADERAFAASVHSLFTFEADTVAGVYGGVYGVSMGLKLIEEKLDSRGSPLDFELARYAVGMIQLESQLRRLPAMQAAIRDGLTTIRDQMKFFTGEDTDGGVHPKLSEKIGELYQQTLSTLSPRIMVNGENDHLTNPLIAARVRAALFAGIRSAFLWRQKGGRRWQLLFFRRRIANSAAELIQQQSAPE